MLAFLLEITSNGKGESERDETRRRKNSLNLTGDHLSRCTGRKAITETIGTSS